MGNCFLDSARVCVESCMAFRGALESKCCLLENATEVTQHLAGAAQSLTRLEKLLRNKEARDRVSSLPLKGLP